MCYMFVNTHKDTGRNTFIYNKFHKSQFDDVFYINQTIAQNTYICK